MTQAQGPAIREVITKDEFGRLICTQYKDFWAYVEKKKMVKNDLFKLNAERREEFFMKWKHGSNDINSNWEFEHSLRYFLKSFQDMPVDDIDPYFRASVIVRRKFEEYCDIIKAEIGLWNGKKPEVPPEVQKLVDSVGGTVVAELIYNDKKQ